MNMSPICNKNRQFDESVDDLFDLVVFRFDSVTEFSAILVSL